MSRENIERILIYRLGSLGDTLLALPAFCLVRERFPKAKITFLTHVPEQRKAPPLISILENTGLYDGVISYPLGTRSAGRLAELRREIAAGRFQMAVHLAESRGRAKSFRDYWFLRSCGIPWIVGTPWHKEDLECQPAASGYEWEAERLARRVSALGSINLNENKWWDLRLTPAELSQADELLGGLPEPFIAAGPGAKVDAKDWTEPNWTALLRRMGNTGHPGALCWWVPRMSGRERIVVRDHGRGRK